MNCNICGEEYYLLQGHRCKNEVTWVGYANEAEARIELLKTLVLEIRSELVEHTEGNFFKEWIDKAERELGFEALKQYSDSKQNDGGPLNSPFTDEEISTIDICLNAMIGRIDVGEFELTCQREEVVKLLGKVRKM